MTSAENDDGRPERDGPSDWLRGLPAEWGRIVIPDDPAALAAEAEAVRRELRARRRRRPGDPRPALGHRRAGRRPGPDPDPDRAADAGRSGNAGPAANPDRTLDPDRRPDPDRADEPDRLAVDPERAAVPAPGTDPNQPGDGHWPTDQSAPLRYAPTSAVPRLPLMVLAIAVLATLTSFLAAMWPGHSRSVPGQIRETASRRPAPANPTGRVVPALDLVDEKGSTVALRSLLPAVVLLVERCHCPAAGTAATSAAPPGVTVIVLSGGSSGAPTASSPPTAHPAAGSPLRSLADPAGGLRRFLRSPARPGEASVLLVDRAGEVVRFLPTAHTPEDYAADLAVLAPS